MKELFKSGYELEVVYNPDPGSRLSGEVKGEIIYIYEEDEERAINTLKHEFLDYLISSVTEPYRLVVNVFIRTLNEIAYDRKEEFIEKLVKLL